MKGIITLAFTHFITLGMAQTPLIAHKSHSGTTAAFFIDPSSNFGAIRIDMENERPLEPLKLNTTEHFIPLNDSTMIVETKDFNQQVIKVDTLPNKQRYSDAIFRYKYQDSIRKEEQLKHEQELRKQQEEQKKQIELQQQQLNETPKKKEKKSYLLFLFGITGGGMLLIQLFRSSKPQKSIV